jgi:hypothetical protein
MAISIFSPVFILYQIIPAIFAILAGVFLILTEKYNDKEIEHSKYFIYAGALIILSRIVLLILIIFEIQLITGGTITFIAYAFLANALIQHFPILIIFVAFFSYIAIHNKETLGNHFLYVAFIGTIYGVLLIIIDLGVFYWILGYAPLEIALAVGLAAFIVFVITFIFMILVGVNHINKFFAIAGACFLLEYFFVAFILILLI